jgi:hypothetical protein
LQWLLDHVELFDDEGNPMSRDDLKVDASRDDEADDEAVDKDQESEESE